MLLTVVLIVVLLSIGFATFEQQTKVQKNNRAVQQVAWAVKQARHYARIHGEKTELIFNSGERVYAINADGENLINNSRIDAFSGVLPEGNQFLNNNCGTIYFDVDGSPVDSLGDVVLNDCTVTIGYDSDIQRDLTLKAISGNVIYEK